MRELETTPHRPDIVLERIAPPTRLTREAVAFAVEVDHHAAFVHSRAAARFVLLHDPEPPAIWASTLRVICYVKAPLEPDLGLDPFVAGVAWSWLEDALVDEHAVHRSLSGTVTKTINTGFGVLSSQTDGTEVELRASWSAEPSAPVRPHLLAWIDLIAHAASLPPVSDGVAVLQPSLAGAAPRPGHGVAGPAGRPGARERHPAKGDARR
ncbi:DUF3000 domain-containing protein [Pseudoclavibacter caeni]